MTPHERRLLIKENIITHQGSYIRHLEDLIKALKKERSTHSCVLRKERTS